MSSESLGAFVEDAAFFERQYQLAFSMVTRS